MGTLTADVVLLISERGALSACLPGMLQHLVVDVSIAPFWWGWHLETVNTESVVQEKHTYF